MYGYSEKLRCLFSSPSEESTSTQLSVTLLFQRIPPYKKFGIISLQGPCSPVLTSQTQLEMSTQKLKWRRATHALLSSQYESIPELCLSWVTADLCTPASFCKQRPNVPLLESTPPGRVSPSSFLLSLIAGANFPE